MADKEKRGKHHVYLQHTLLEQCEANEPGWAASLDVEGISVAKAMDQARKKLGRPIDVKRGKNIKEGMSKSTKRQKQEGKKDGEETSLGAMTIDPYQIALTMSNAYAYFLNHQDHAKELLSNAAPILSVPPLPSSKYVQLGASAAVSVATDANPCDASADTFVVPRPPIKSKHERTEGTSEENH
jgi:hypothetical protein